MSQHITIRAAEPEDAEAIFHIASGRQVQHGTLQTPYQPLARWRERLSTTDEHTYRLVAERDGQVLGMAGLHLLTAPRMRHVGQIGMMVQDEYQGQGIGRALLDGLLDLADNWLNLHRIELQVYTDNAPAIHLYESCGFVIEGTLRDFAYREGGYTDAYVMGRVREPSRDR